MTGIESLLKATKKLSAVTRFRRDSRGVSINVGYTFTVGITAVLLIGLIMGVGTVLETQRDRAVNQQVTVISDQTAAAVMATERMAQSGTHADATLTHNLPRDVVGTPYRVRLVDPPSRDPQVIVEVIGSDYESASRLVVESDVEEAAVTGGQDVQIVREYDDTSGQGTITLQSVDES